MSNTQINDFVCRYPHGTDLKLPERLPLRRFVPSLYAEAVLKEGLIEQARAKGYSHDDLVKLARMLYEPELTLVSIDEEEA